MGTAPLATELDPALLTDPPETADADLCDSCVHRLDGHDRISLRYCQATHAGGFSRGCVCPLDASGAAKTKPVAFR